MPEYKTDTATGAAWVEKYLHPPSALRASYNGIPDLNNTPSVNLEYRLESEQSPPSTNASTLYLLPPSVYTHSYRFAVDSNGSLPPFGEESLLVPENPNVELPEFSKTAESYRMAYRSTTFYQDATAFNNAGMIYTSQFRPNVALYTERDITAFHQRFHSHKGAKEAIKLLTKSMTVEDGFEKLGLTDKVGLPSTGNVIQVISLGKIPTTGGEVLMRSPKSVARRANEGAFVVHQFSEPTQSYKSMARSYDKISPPTPPLRYGVFSYYEYQNSANELVLASFSSRKDGSSAPDLPWYDMTWAFVLYTPAIGTDTAAPLLLKTIIGVEVQPTSGSLLQAVVKDSPLYDQQALRMASMMRQQMPDSLPASANDFSSFIGAALEWAPKIFSAIKGIFAPKPSESEVKHVVKEEVKRGVVANEAKQAPTVVMRASKRPVLRAPAQTMRVPQRMRAQTVVQPMFRRAQVKHYDGPITSHTGMITGGPSSRRPTPQRQQTGAQNISGSAPIAMTVRPSRSTTPRRANVNRARS
jgi:hypothetical protein